MTPTNHNTPAYIRDALPMHPSSQWSVKERKQKKKIGIAGLCVWTVLLGVVIAHSYSKKQKSFFKI